MKNKKSTIQFTIIGIMLTLITFFIIGNFLLDVNKTLTTSTQDIACRTFLSVKNSTVTKITEEFIGDLNQKCNMDEVNYIFENKEKTFDITSEMMRKCWYRYGEGKYDFLSNVNSEGNWCFTCAKIDFKVGGDDYDYNEFIEYLKSNNIKIKNEEGNEIEISLFEYVNIQYADIKGEDMYEIKREIEELLAENEPALEPMILQVNGEYEYIMDLRLKEISTNEPMYIVYRYDKPNNDFLDAGTQAMVGAMGGMIVGMGISMGASVALEIVTYAAIGTMFGGPVGALIGGVGGTLFVTAKKILKIGDKGGNLLKKLNGIRKKLASMRKTSKLFKETSEVVEISTSLKTIDIQKLAKHLEKVSPDLSKKYTELHENLVKLKIDNLDELDNIIKSEADWLNYYKKSYENSFELMHAEPMRIAMDDALKIVKNQEDVVEQLSVLRKEMDDIGKLDFDELMKQGPEGQNKINKYIKYAFITSTTLAGAGIGSELNFYEYQYVDIMTQEQYYRLCGTHSYIPK